MESPKGEEEDIKHGRYSMDVSYREDRLANTVEREFKRAQPS